MNTATAYTASCIIDINGNTSIANGAYMNIRIDGNMDIEKAKHIAKDHFITETKLRHKPYTGFIIEKTERFREFKQPLIVDNNSISISI